MPTSPPTALQVASRVAAGLLGGYGFVWGLTALGIAGSVALGMDYDEAQGLFFLLAFLVFTACFCSAFAVRSLVWLWTVLAGGGAVMTLAAWLIARALV